MGALSDALSLDLPADGPSGMRKIVFVAGVLLSYLWLQLYFALALSSEERATLVRAVNILGSDAATAGFFSILAVLLSLFGVHFLRLHESVYDAAFVRWRRRHDGRFLLPRLFSPYATLFRRNYEYELRKHSVAILDATFCHFLKARGEQIEERLVHRFYRALALQWIALLVECALILWLLAITGHIYLGAHSSAHQLHLISVLYVGGILCLVNMLLVRRATKALVEKRCQAEIDDIHIKYPDRLRDLVVSAARRYEFLRPPPGDVAQPAEVRVPIASRDVPGLWDHAFVASPMASLSAEAYVEDRALVLRVVDALRHAGFRQVFYAGTALEGHAKFEDPYLALIKDLQQIRKCGTFVLHWPTRVPSSALFELGYALALGKRAILLVRNHAELPYLVGPLAQLTRVWECSYRNEEDLLENIVELSAALFADEQAATAREDGAQRPNAH